MAIDINIPSQVKEYADVASFPSTGNAKTIYVAEDTNKLYRWNGTTYVILSPSEASSWGGITGNLSSQLDLQGELDNKFDIPTGDTTQYLDGAGLPTTFPAIPTNTSDLTNDGANGTNPFITALDIPTFASADKMVTVGRNSTGSTLYKGTIVYISGSTGNRPNFVKAKADIEATSAGTFGVIESDIANNADGNCVTIGTINNLDTRTSATHPFTSDTLADGDTIYLSPTTAGYITNVKPSAPDHLVYLGKVARTSPTNGTIVYRVQNGYEIEELHNVAISSVADNNIIQYDSATSLWKNESLSTAGIQPTLVSGTNIKTLEGQSLLGSGNIDLSQSDVGLANVDNTSDANKPISTATQTALNAKENSITPGTTAQYFRGDKTFQTLDKSAVGLGNVDNTSDANKPVSTATQTALNAKQNTLVSGTSIKTVNSTSLLGSGDVAVQPTLVSGTNIKTINGSSVLGSGDLTISGGSATWGGITGTLSSQTDLQTALDAKVNKTTTLIINGISKDLTAASLTWQGINKVIGVISTAQTAVTGTTNDTRTASIWIPANTFSGGSGLSYALEINARIVKTGVNGTQRLNMYINTNDTLTGATWISTHTATSSGNLYVQQQRNFSWYGQNLTGLLTTGTSYSDFITTTSAPQSVTWTNNIGYYLIFSIQLGSTLDSSVLNYAKATVYGY